MGSWVLHWRKDCHGNTGILVEAHFLVRVARRLRGHVLRYLK